MGASETVRARARAALTQEILSAARRQLAAAGAGQLSLRAVARELEMAPSGLYRYFPSRDALLTGSDHRGVQRGQSPGDLFRHVPA